MNNHNETRWLTWLVRIVLPVLIAAMWLGLSGRLDDLRDEILALRIEMRGEQTEQAEHDQEQDIRLTQHDERLALVLRTLFGD